MPFHWLLSFEDRTLTCLRLDGGAYVEEAAATPPATARSAALGGLEIPTAELFG